MGHIFDAIQQADQAAAQRAAAATPGAPTPGAPTPGGPTPDAAAASPASPGPVRSLNHPINLGFTSAAPAAPAAAATPRPAAHAAERWPDAAPRPLSIHGADEADGPAPLPLIAAAPPPQTTAHPADPHNPESLTDLDDRLIAALEPASPITEDYRALRTGILARWQNKRHLVHTLTSPAPREGKTLTCLNLALALAELHERRTLVLEADLRLPRFARMLNLPADGGLVRLLEGQASLEQVTHRVGRHGLSVLTAGSATADIAVQLLNSPALPALLKELRKRYDHVLIDTPPVVELADAGLVGALSDDVFLVVRIGHTPRGMVDQAMRVLAGYNAPVSGLIATDDPRGQDLISRQPQRVYGYSQLAQAA